MDTPDSDRTRIEECIRYYCKSVADGRFVSSEDLMVETIRMTNDLLDQLFHPSGGLQLSEEMVQEVTHMAFTFAARTRASVSNKGSPNSFQDPDLRRRIADIAKITRESDDTVFLSNNGSTMSLHVVMQVISECSRHEGPLMIAVDRSCHKAVSDAISELDVHPLYFGSAGHPRTGLPAPAQPKDLEDAIKRIKPEDPKLALIVVTSPTYDGEAADLNPFYEIAKNRGVALLIDQAWAPHWLFISNHGEEVAADFGIPIHASTGDWVEDIDRDRTPVFCIVSPHKILPGGAETLSYILCYNMTPLLLRVTHNTIDRRVTTSWNPWSLRLADRQVTECTSPGWLEETKRAHHLIKEFAEQVNKASSDLGVAEQFGALLHQHGEGDSLRVTIWGSKDVIDEIMKADKSVSEDRVLRNMRRKISQNLMPKPSGMLFNPEKVETKSILLLASSDVESLRMVSELIIGVVSRLVAELRLDAPSASIQPTSDWQIPKMVLTPFKAAALASSISDRDFAVGPEGNVPTISTTRIVPLDKADGQAVAERVMAYPPGRPLVIDGERISEREIDVLQRWAEEEEAGVTRIIRGEKDVPLIKGIRVFTEVAIAEATQSVGGDENER